MGISQTAQNQGASAYGTMQPIFSQMATNPQGLTEQQKANMLTSSQQSLGGGQSAAAGAGALMAARSGNAGAAVGAISDSARQAGVTGSQNALGIQNQDAMLARQQQEQGLNGLQGIYNTGNQTSVNALNTANQAAKPFWQQMLLQGMASGGQVAAAAAGAPSGG